MEFQNISSKFLRHSADAYNKFLKYNIPFTAVKIYFFNPSKACSRADKIILDNFRSKKDFILKSKSDYAIIMKDTSFRAAEAAINRLRLKLYYELLLDASIYIYGVCEKKNKLRFKHFDLSNYSSFPKGVNNFNLTIRKYYSCSVSIKNTKNRSISIRI